MTAPIIVTALLGRADFRWLDGLRRANYPPERNQVPAHLTLFHHLPPSVAGELGRRLRAETSGMPPPAALIDRVLMLGRGVALGVRSEALSAIRERLAEAFAGCLTAQDPAGWRPHVTVQNKVAPAEARALYSSLAGGFAPAPVQIVGLTASYYRGGPWEAIATYRFAR